MELLSIIVPVYNVSAYVARCVDSLIKQSWEAKEIILVDDGSTDNSGELCDAFAAQYSCVSVIHKPNGGLSSARNAGLDVAKGEYVGFVDSDDWTEPNMFQILIENLVNAQADISACDFIHDYATGAETKVVRAEQVHIYDQKKLYQMTIDTRCFAGYAWNKIYRRSVIGDLRFDESLASCEDIDFISKLVGACRCGVYESVGLYHYFHHAQSMTGERNYSYRKIAVIDVYERLIPLYTEVCPECLSVIYTNYLKININVKGRYLCSKINQPEILARLNQNISSCYPRVMRDANIPVSTKLNILMSKAMPGTLLRIKQFILQQKQRGN